MNRPAETTSGTIGIAVGAVVGLLAGLGITVPPGVVAPVITIIGLVSGAVTWWISRRQAAGTLKSGATGKVSR